MSYDYNSLVSKIASSRRLAAEASNPENKLLHLQECVETFAELSGHCPMTPLLWMQYSRDTADLLLLLSGETEPSPTTNASAQATQLQLLELALSEFPGSAILHVRYLQLLCQTVDSSYEKVHAALVSALEMVGRGSHRNEGVLVAAIYRLAIDVYSKHDHIDKTLATFVCRAQTPMKDVNDSLAAEFESFRAAHPEMTFEKYQETMQAMEEARRYESRTYHTLVASEDEVDVAMHNESILPRHQVDLEQLPWDTILRSDSKLCWMGYGGVLSADAFIKYAQTCYRYRIRTSSKKGDLSREEQEHIRQDEETVQQLALCVYERAAAECPTVEAVWLKYIRHLQYLAQKDRSLLSRLKSVVDRSARNCPYSLQLHQQRLLLLSFFAEQGAAILDPDELQKIVDDVIESRFISSREACLELYMTASRILRRRLLFLLAKAPVVSHSKSTTIPYDEAEEFVPGKYSFNFSELDDATCQEVEDLCDDCRDFYETIDAYLKKNHANWSEGRWRLLSERSFVEVHALVPLSVSLGDNAFNADDHADKKLEETIQLYEKLVKIYQPTPPDSYMAYIHTLQSSFPTSKPSCVISKLRQLRCLFQRAIKTVGRPKGPIAHLDPLIQRDFDSGLRNLCHEYLVFERYFGSDKSLALASAAVQKKVARSLVEMPEYPKLPQETQLKKDEMMVDKELEVGANPSTVEESTNKHALDREGGEEPPTKKVKTNDQVNLSTKAKEVHKAKFGNMEYPAHPFTIRVSNLGPDVEDMDLVDTFRPRCGAIVHAKIMRDKSQNHSKGKSKGWGVVQFELQESVERALALSDVIGIHEKLVNVERSHMPAVTLVPPGMHRVKPTGEGRNSRLNQKKRELKGMQGDKVIDKPSGVSEKPTEPPREPIPPQNSLGVLAFRPRGVQQKRKPPKMKIGLGDDGTNRSK